LEKNKIAWLFDMARLSSVIVLLTLIGAGFVCAGEIVTFQELESYFYVDGKLERSEGRFESSYYIEGNTITRIRVTDLKNNEIQFDKTTFSIDRNLRSDPTKGLGLQGKGVVRATGRCGIDGVEMLSITEQFLVSVRSTSDFFEISRSKRIK
jgi:hypothetical protein